MLQAKTGAILGPFWTSSGLYNLKFCVLSYFLSVIFLVW